MTASNDISMTPSDDVGMTPSDDVSMTSTDDISAASHDDISVCARPAARRLPTEVPAFGFRVSRARETVRSSSDNSTVKQPHAHSMCAACGW